MPIRIGASPSDVNNKTLMFAKVEGEISKEKSDAGESSRVRFEVNRPVYTTKSLQKIYPGLEEADSGAKFTRPQLSKKTLLNIFLNFFPLFRWLPEYQYKELLIGDIVSGITVGVVSIPQSIAFSILAGLAPVFGLYTSIYPPLMYLLTGTSRHLSIGSFAILSLLTQDAVLRLAPEPDAQDDSTTLRTPNAFHESPLSSLTELEIRRVRIATTVTFLSGLFQLGFGFLRLGFLLNLLSPPLIKGLTTGSAIYIITSQMPAFLGMPYRKSTGYFQPIEDWRIMFSDVYSTHLPTFIIGIISFAVLVAGRFINNKYKSRLRVPLPTDIIVVIIALLSSYYGKLESNYNVDIVRNVPTGFPVPAVPDLSVVSEVVYDAFSIAVVGLAINVALAKLYSARFDYDVDLSQEMVAYGSANFVSSFFYCFPSAASLSRCEILVNSGGKTQVVGLIGFIVIIFTVLFLGPVFEPLPKAILSSVVIAGLLGIMGQLLTIPDLFRKSKQDFMIWLVTFFCILTFSISMGLLIGVVFSTLIVILRTQIVKCEKLTNIPKTELYVNHKSANSVRPVDEILIFKFNAILYFGNKDIFAKKLECKVREPPSDMKPITPGQNAEKVDFSSVNSQVRGDEFDSKSSSKKEPIPVRSRQKIVYFTRRKGNKSRYRERTGQTTAPTGVKFIVIDCSSFSYLDLPAAELLKGLWKKYSKFSIEFILAHVTSNARSVLQKSGYYQSDSDVLEFLTIHDAVLYCKAKSSIMDSTSYVSAALSITSISDI